MFPVTRQVRRKRTPVFGRPGRMRGARMRARRAEEPAPRGRARAGAGGRGAEGRAEAGWARGESSVRLRDGAPSGSGEARGLGREQGGGLGENVRSPDKQTYRWPPDGQAAHPGLCRLFSPGDPSPRTPLGEKTPRPPRNQRCDPAGPAAVAEMPGPIRWDTAPSWSPHNPRTPACA
jgi:hypothetical protein